MYDFKSLAERRAVTRSLIDDEIDTNKFGYNPISKKIIALVNQNAE